MRITLSVLCAYKHIGDYPNGSQGHHTCNPSLRGVKVAYFLYTFITRRAMAWNCRRLSGDIDVDLRVRDGVAVGVAAVLSLE